MAKKVLSPQGGLGRALVKGKNVELIKGLGEQMVNK